MKNLKIVFFGTPDFVVPILKSLQKSFTLSAIVTTPDSASGRQQIISPSPVALLAHQLKIPALKPAKLTDLTSTLAEFSADLFIVASFGKIIPQSILDLPKYGSLNVHPSILPKYRGASPIQSQLLDGVQDSGISIILMDAEMDHGPIVHLEPFQFRPFDTFESLHFSMFAKAAEILPEVIDKFVQGSIKPVEQNHSKATYCSHIVREDGYFDLKNPPSNEQLDRMIRAYYPWPTAWTRWKGKIVKLLPENKIQIEGKNPTTLKNFLNGYPDFPIK